MNVYMFLPLASTAGVIHSIFAFWAVVRYQFLTIRIQDVAADLFAKVQDGVIIYNNRREIVQFAPRFGRSIPADRVA